MKAVQVINPVHGMKKRTAWLLCCLIQNQGQFLSETEWPIHPAIDEYEICSAEEDESEFEQESN